jgi:outer membrane lipoprotein-sorting protein
LVKLSHPHFVGISQAFKQTWYVGWKQVWHAQLNTITTMKKIFIYAFLLLAPAAKVFAQKDTQAKAILSQVSQKYKAYDAVKTDFTLTVSNPQQGINQTQAGTLITRSKANKYKVTVYANAGKSAVEQEIISDGKSQWTYLKKEKEVQVNDAGSGDEGLNPAKIFTMYEKGYKYLYSGDQKIGGKAYQIVDLTPTDSKNPFFKIRLLVDKVKKQLYSAQLFDKNGNRYNYTIKTFTPDAKVTDAAFTFDKKAHPGVEVVDLR